MEPGSFFLVEPASGEVKILTTSFDRNSASAGHAVYAAGISDLKITDSTFVNNRPVDAYQESLVVPPYTKYLLNADPSAPPVDLSSFTARTCSAGEATLEYLFFE